MKEVKLEVTYLPIDEVTPYEGNVKLHPQDQIEQLKNSIEEFGMNDPIAVWGEDNLIVEGHGRLIACKELGYETVPIIRLDGLTEDQRKAYTLAHNKLTMNTGFDVERLEVELNSIEFDMSKVGFELAETEKVDIKNKYDDAESGSMVKNFGCPPFSVLDTRQGYWQDGRRVWLDLGIRSELGRDDDLLGGGLNELAQMTGANVSGTSVFDPYLCEILYRWFAPQYGKILDPFAGGSVRGVVASRMGYDYTGIELRTEQVEANREQVADICEGYTLPKYINGDSNVELDKLDGKYDFVFSCPPYADLEEYSDDPADLSTMEYNDFLKVYKSIIKKAVDKLEDNRFACFVVSEVRGKDGNFYNFVPDTIKAFEEAGLHYYNEIILINSATTLALRAGKIMRTSRKVGRTHQNVLVFFKGDSSKIKEIYGEYGVTEMEENPGQNA